MVGLGNPDSKYERTRHNIGFLTVQAFADSLGLRFKDERKFLGKVASGSCDGVTVRLLLPMTYMNNSGMAVRRYADFFRLNVDEILVVTDDVVLGFGVLRLRTKGGAGGHNGLKSVEEHMRTSQYARLRVGVGDREHGELSDHVLGRFSSQEMKTLPNIIKKSTEVISRWLYEDVYAVMNDVNIKDKKPDKEKLQQESPEDGTGEYNGKRN